MHSARDAFLGTPELLELMFLQSDLRTLLTAGQRVCRQWHEIIAKSPDLQVHLFKKPSRHVSESRPRANPLLSEVFPSFFQNDPSSCEGFHGRSAFEKSPFAHCPEPFRRKDASWRDLQVRQPPLRVLGIHRPCDGYTRVYEREITMGVLYDCVLQILTDSQRTWKIVWRDVPQAIPAPDEDGKRLLDHVLQQVEGLLIHRAAPGKPSAVRFGAQDRDFLEKFTHPNRLRSLDLGMTPASRVIGNRPRGGHREL